VPFWPRPAFYLFFGWFSLIPVGHLVYMDGSFWFVWRIGRFVLLMGIIYSVAAAIYVSQIPERWAPGMFDYSVRHTHPPRPTHSGLVLMVCVLCSAKAM
jgi:predicted membrane channel-forming protein YqfA (hemolysin III family)